MTDKRIAVTGGAGFLGSHIVEGLRSRGYRNIFVPRSRDYNLTEASAVERLLELHRPDVVIHAAGSGGGIGANRANPGRFFYENAIMGMRLIEAARRYGTEKLVVLGTICAYPKFTPVPFREQELWNGYPEETEAPVGIAQRALLLQCQAYRKQYGMNAIFLVSVNLYGPGDNFDMASSHVIPALIRKCAEAVDEGRDEIVLWGDGSPTREFLYVEDTAEGIILATEHYNKPHPVNIGSGTEISIAELAAKIASITGFSGRITWDTQKPNGQPRRCLDVSRAQREFGFRAGTPLDVGLRRTIECYQSRRLQSGQAVHS